MPLGNAMPFGIRDIKITPYSDAGATTLAGSSIDLPYAQTLKISETEDFEELRGDDKRQAKRGKGPQGTFEMSAGGLSLPALAALNGGTVTSSGTTPAQINSYRVLDSKVKPFFKAEGQSLSDLGGDVHGIAWLCRVTDTIDYEMSDGTWWITGANGDAFGSRITASLGALYDIIQNETAVAIP